MENNQKNLEIFFKEYLEKWSCIQQNPLMSETKIIRFARDRGILVSGSITGDPSNFLERDWLSSDELPANKRTLFHPFRIYSLHIIVSMCDLHISPSSSLNRDSYKNYLIKVSEFLPSLEFITEKVRVANEITNLAILLEPIYWPIITSRTRYSSPMTYDEHKLKVELYKEKILVFVKNLDPNIWCEHHKNLRITAAKLDGNTDLYLLLRSAPWEKRKQITGQIGGALWFRHIAEVIRRAFTDVHNVTWLEEDQAVGQWHIGTRERIYGTERPIDNILISRPHLAFEFGLYTGSTIRWYLEGETEYYAALFALPKAALGGIEVINLKGAVGNEKANIALRLTDGLAQDKELRRFSFISFDNDVPANTKAIRKQIEAGNVVGYINCNQPDFEFGNFTLEELVEIAARIDEEQGADTEKLRTGNQDKIDTGKKFEAYYCQYSNIGKALKGEKWGRALANYALDYPLREDNNCKRPFIETLDWVLSSRKVRYEYQRDNFYIDLHDFKNKNIISNN
ncbi:MAG: hypothetical protein EOO69_00440 [Moraxellaceae bacterium]|nr:MAG: hypothetical protein EOO69_00440 [Moraxellaceae bacterium]